MLNSIANGISGSLGSYVMELLYRMPAILVALAFHEWAHAYAAYKLGDPTAYNLGRMGRLTLNTIPHIDPVGLIMFVLTSISGSFVFGWAKPVPVSTRNFKHPRRDEIIVSLAGVAMNLVLAFVTMLIFFGLMVAGKAGNAALNTIFYYFYFINLGLCVFNILPIPPLDGFHVASCLFMRSIGPKPFMFLQKYGFVILIVLLMTNWLDGIMSSAVNFLMSGMMNICAAIYGLLGLM
mgnify:CR=1 FL=1